MAMNLLRRAIINPNHFSLPRAAALSTARVRRTAKSPQTVEVENTPAVPPPLLSSEPDVVLKNLTTASPDDVVFKTFSSAPEDVGFKSDVVFKNSSGGSDDVVLKTLSGESVSLRSLSNGSNGAVSKKLSSDDVVKKPRPSDWPRPSEIPYQAKVANSVNLIGLVKQPVQFKSNSDGNAVAGTVIAHENASSSSYWIPVVFEGDLAHVAACHLKEKDHIYVAGHLVADVQPGAEIAFNVPEGQASFQVMAHSINFVGASSQQKKGFMSSNQEEKTTYAAGQAVEDIPRQAKVEGKAGASTKMDKASYLGAWRDLFNNPEQWLDNRESKRKGLLKEKFPDFKHKESGLALWLWSAPEWVWPGLNKLKVDASSTQSKQLKASKDEDSWKDLVENPSKWWDNRTTKKNVKGPDFKSKDSDKGLWLDSAPTWVLPNLPPLREEKVSWTSKSL